MKAPITQVKRDLCELVDQVEKGGLAIILRNGRPVARLLPMPGRGKPWRVEKPDDPKLYKNIDLDAPGWKRFETARWVDTTASILQ